MPSFIAELALNQGVSFFFVLSGFILTYVYRELPSKAKVKEFYVHRIARIWPVHMAATLLLFVLIPGSVWALFSSEGVVKGLLYVTMMHAWIPLWKFFLGLNGVSWTISVEMFFYLVFPLFLASWGKYEKLKLMVAAAPAIAVIAFSNFIDAPNADWAPGLTRHGLIYIFPPSRLFEFVCGVFAAKAWLSRREGRPMGAASSFLLEAAAIMAVYVAILYCRHPAVSAFFKGIGGDAGAHWINVNGFTPVFVFLIYIFASSTGPAARIVGSRPVVLLGEISFSLYMVHTTVLGLFERFPNTIESMTTVPMVAYWVASVATAYCMWYFVETPFRRAIVKWYEGQPEALDRIAGYFTKYSAPVLAGGLTLFFGSILIAPRPEVQFASEGSLTNLTFHPPAPVVFGDKFELLGIAAIPNGQQTFVDVYLKAKENVTLDQSIALHALRGSNIVGDAAIKLDMAESPIVAGKVWKERLVLGNGSFSANPAPMGIAIYDSKGLLPLTQGQGDWNSSRYRFEMNWQQQTN